MTTVVTAIVALGVLSQALRPHIPKVPTNAMKKETDPFLRAAQYQPIPWHPLSPEVFSESTATGRPILLFVGVVTSQAAREADQAFTDADVSRYVGRQFVPVRVDGLEEPAWINAMHPISRMDSNLTPEAQIWLLDQTGQPYFQIRRMRDRYYSAAYLLDQLHEGINQWRGAAADTPESVAQRSDLQSIQNPIPRLHGELRSQRARILESLDYNEGGFVQDGVRTLDPLAFLAVMKSGDVPSARTGLDATLASPLRDVLFGGFYHSAQSAANRVDFDKWTVENAEMTATLATAYRVTRRPAYAEASVQGLVNIAKDLMGTAYLTAGEIGAVNERSRSDRHSFSPQTLRERLTSAEYEFAANSLGLDPSQNAQGIPYFRRPPEHDEWVSVRRKLMAKPPKPKLAPEGYADVHLGTLARCIEATRQLGDVRRQKLFVEILDHTAPYFRDSDGGVRRTALRSEDGMLCDYLAYADAKLQDYLATGRYVSLQDGLGVLKLALNRFRLGPGQFTLAPSSHAPLFRFLTPEYTDNLHEGSLAMAARLFLAYGRLLGERASGPALQKAGRKVIAYGAAIAQAGSTSTAGFLSASLEVFDGAYAISVGPNAADLASALSRRRPLRFVAAATGDVRSDLLKRGPGIYVIGPTGITGPVGIAEAAQRLPDTFKTSR